MEKKFKVNSIWSELNVVIANVCFPRGIFDSMSVMSSMISVYWSSEDKDKEHLFTQMFAQREFKGKCVD